ncbi:MAG: hypothetical protein ACTMIK_03895 [Galactobacter sp.]
MSSFSTTSRLSAAAGIALLAALGLSACGGDSPSANSSCSDYVDMSKDDQIKAVQDLAKELGQANISKDEAEEQISNFAKACETDDFKDGTLSDMGKKITE